MNSEGPNYPAHLSDSLLWCLSVYTSESSDPKVDREDSDKTVQMQVIWAFALGIIHKGTFSHVTVHIYLLENDLCLLNKSHSNQKNTYYLSVKKII